MKKGMLIVLSGPGAVGKDTMIGKLLPADPKLRYSVSYTTRPKRDYEVDGQHYSFVDVATFEKLVEAGEFLEHEPVNGNLYGTSRRRVEEAMEAGYDVILKIDVKGAERVRAQRPDAVFVFLSPPSMEELMRRRDQRNSDPPAVRAQRQELAELEMAFAGRYDYVVVNDDADRAADEIRAIIAKERERRCQ